MRGIISGLLVLVLLLTASPSYVAAQTEPVLNVGGVSVPFVYRDGYYVATATVAPQITSFSAGGGSLPSFSQQISVQEERLLVVSYHDGQYRFGLYPVASDGAVGEDVKLARYPEGAVLVGTEVTFYAYTPRRDVSKVVLTLTDRALDDEQAPTSAKPKNVANVEMVKVAESSDGFYDVWVYKFSATSVTWYQYTAYAYDGAKRRKVGEGRLTVYDPAFKTPDWMKNAIIYQKCHHIPDLP